MRILLINNKLNNNWSKKNFYSNKTNAKSTKYSSVTTKESISFRGVKGLDGLAKSIKKELHIKIKNENIELPENQKSFIADYEEKEKEIKEKYDKKIAAIKGNYFDHFINISEKKRNKLRNDKDKELKVAHMYQEAFEKRENELLDFKSQYLDMAINLNYNSEVITALQKEKFQSEKRAEIEARKRNNFLKTGFDKIAGYFKERTILNEKFIDIIKAEKSGENVSLPNAILFYGPTGCGKTTFAKALAQEADCHFKIISCHGSQQEKEKQLLIQLNGDGEDVKGLCHEAETDYLSTGLRTIALIDEFDRFFGDNPSKNLVKALKGIMESCSSQSHLTLFLATNEPRKIPEELLNDQRTRVKVNLDPPDKTNMQQLLAHYLPLDKIHEDFDSEKILDKLFEYSPNEIYSNSQVENICDIAMNDIKPSDSPLTTDMFFKAIDKYNNSSDNHDELRLTKKYLEQYEIDKKTI